jgi:hypothetical protein
MEQQKFIDLAEDILATIGTRKHDMENSRPATNDLIVTDILMGLGYNMRRDTSVERIYSGDYDWSLESAQGDAVAVYTVPACKEITLDNDLMVAFETLSGVPYKVVLVTNAETLEIWKYDNESENKYKRVYTVDFKSLDDTDFKVLDAVSKQGFDEDILDEISKDCEVTVEKIKKLFDTHIKGMLLNLVTNSGADENEASNVIDEFMNKMSFDNESIVSGGIDISNEEVNKLRAMLNESNEKIKRLESNEARAESDKVDSYIEQIRDLNIKMSDKDKKIEELEEENKDLKDQINQLSGSDRKRAQEMLDLMDDNPESPRNYVAVVNSELLQNDNLHTFVGRVMQKLYGIKSLEASQYIFNGELFKLNSNAVRNDLRMNSKNYDIDFREGETEDEILNKLRVLMSNFSDVVFECKKIGSLHPVKNQAYEDGFENPGDSGESQGFDGNEQDFNGNEQDFDESDSYEEDGLAIDSENGNFEGNIGAFDSGEQGFNEEADGQGFEENESAEDSGFDSMAGFNADNNEFEPGFNSETDSFGEFIPDETEVPEENDEFTSDKQRKPVLLACQLSTVDELIWSDEEINFKSVKYITDDQMKLVFSINNDGGNDNTLCKCINAMLAIEAHKKNKDIIKQVKLKNFSQVNSFIKLYTEQYKDCPRINGTKYAICGVSTVGNIGSALNDIGKALNIDTSSMFIYFEAETDSYSILDNYQYDENYITPRENVNFVSSGNNTMKEVVLRGDMLSSIVITKNSLQVQKEILSNIVAVKTKYIGKVIHSSEGSDGALVNSNEDVAEVFSKMLMEARANGTNIDPKDICTVIGTGYKLMSYNENDVAPDHMEMSIEGEKIYISKLENWQMVESLVKVHTVLFNNTGIAIKIHTNVDAINFYGTQFCTAEPTLSLAVNSLVNYVTSCFK